MEHQVSKFIETLIKSQVEGAVPTASSIHKVVDEGNPDSKTINGVGVEGLAQDGWVKWEKVRDLLILAVLADHPKNFDLHHAFVSMQDVNPFIPDYLQALVMKELKLNANDNNFIELKLMGNFIYPWIANKCTECTLSTERSEQKGRYSFNVYLIDLTYFRMLYDSSKASWMSVDGKRYIGEMGARWFTWNYNIDAIYQTAFHLQLVSSSNRYSKSKSKKDDFNDDKSEELDR